MQPIEQLAALHSIPDFIDFRPADSKETATAWYFALTRKCNPTGIVLSRQDLPQFKETGVAALKGAYILLDSISQSPDIIIFASGSEVKLAYEAYSVLKEKGIAARVISMPSQKLFDEQSKEYKDRLLPLSKKNRLFKEFGFTVENVVYTAITIIEENRN
jgi:transketolase